jgi:hypothetical protein
VERLVAASIVVRDARNRVVVMLPTRMHGGDRVRYRTVHTEPMLRWCARSRVARGGRTGRGVDGPEVRMEVEACAGVRPGDGVWGDIEPPAVARTPRGHQATHRAEARGAR